MSKAAKERTVTKVPQPSQSKKKVPVEVMTKFQMNNTSINETTINRRTNKQTQTFGLHSMALETSFVKRRF